MILNTENSVESALDWALGDFLTTQIPALEENEKIYLKQALSQLSQDLAQGHSCSEVRDAQQQAVLQKLLAKGEWVSHHKATPLNYEWHPQANQPNVAKLYFHRYWQYETQLAQQLSLKIKAEKTLINHVSSEGIHHFFPTKDAEVDFQRLAVEKSLQQNFSIITGGPGTGKTTTVVKALALMLINHPEWHIALAAPTGKAAMRLQASIGEGIQNLPCEDALKQKIPQEVKTLHRLLGAKYRSPYFKHHAENPLPFDVVVVDEASMIDLALMSKLVMALKPTTKLLLFGDKDQLASVESGAVLADLTQALPEHTHELKLSFRF
jgi:exodeoxyribonuclease V alpha subunit